MIKSNRTKAGDWVVAFLCLLLIMVCLLPLLNVFARSLSSSDALIRNQVTLWPVGWNLEAYRMVLNDSRYTRAIVWTVFLTVIYTVVAMFMTTIAAYPLIYDKLKGRRFFSAIMIFTMYFNAGVIPSYLLYKDLHMLNQPSVLIIPGCLNVFYLIIMRSFLFGIPDSLRESAEIDGASPLRILMSIYLPLSTAVMATLSLFYAVWRWNGYSDGLMFLGAERKYYPIQLLLFNILNSITSIEVSTQEGFSKPGLSDTLKAATVMFATVPILLIYPWLQKYFISGATLGAVKG